MTDQLSAGIASQQRSKAPEGVLLPHVASLPARVGIFGIGLATYWPQFPGLKERLEGYQHRIEEKLAAEGYTIISAGLVDTAPEAKEAGERFMRENVDILLCYVGTYATSSQVVPAVHYVNKPVLVLNLQPTAALNYEHTDTAEWLANCCACCVPEIAGAFTRCNIPFNVVSGLLHEEEGAAGAQAWKEIREWIRAAQVVRTLH
jgi:L-arabinose isomerase